VNERPSTVIDFHVHAAVEEQGMWTPDVWDLIRTHYPDNYRDIKRFGEDPIGFRDHLRSQGVDLCVLLAEDSNRTGLVPNDYILEFAGACPDFFIPFMALNPNKTECFEKEPGRFRDNVRFCRDQMEWLAGRGFRGVKDYGSYNYIPFGSGDMLPFYETAARLGLPVLFHTGESMFDSSRSRAFSNPAGLGTLAEAVPDLSIVVGHCGSGAYFAVAYELAKRFPNVYIEFSGVPPSRVRTRFFDRRLDLNEIPHKLIFGSDYPALPNGPDGIRKNVEAYRALSECDTLSPESCRGLLGENARRLLGIRSGHETE
jgi:predicted TIM-barrel fold metal-dependent hydrolase